jgi:hypothetical protein
LSSKHAVLLPLLACLASLFTGCSGVKARSSGRDGLLDDNGKRVLYKRGAKIRETVIDLDEARAVKLEVDSVGFRWPLAQVRVTSSFGPRGGDLHEGVDLRAPTGTPVYAAAPGTVLYAGNQIRGYGRLVVLRHLNGLSSVYAHNSKLLVIRGQKVKRGQLIARSGSTGHSSGPHVHFEIRKGVSPMNPERAIGGTLVALPDRQLRRPERRVELAASDATRNDSGKPPVSGLRKARAPASRGKKLKKAVARPAKERYRKPARRVKQRPASKKAPKRETYSAVTRN